MNFFSKHLFPGGSFLGGTFIVAAEEAGLKCEEQIAFGKDYARTMDEYWKRFHMNLDDVGNSATTMNHPQMGAPIAGWYAMFKSGHYNVMQAKLAHSS